MTTNDYTITREQIDAELTALEAKRLELISEFGVVLYEATKDDAGLREKYEALYSRVEAVDMRRNELREKMAEMDAEAVKEQLRAHPVNCPRCGREIRVDDSFCSGCGVPADTAREEVAKQMSSAQTVMMPVAQAPLQPACLQCGASVRAGDRFCMTCGQPLDSTAGSMM